MDFFERQDVARRKTSILIVYYILAVIFIMLGVYFAFAATFIGVKTKMGRKIAVQQLWNPRLFLWTIGGTLLVVLGGTVYKVSQLSGGGESVAQLLGGRPIGPNTRDADERKILNVVEEMAIASGTPVPRVFLLEHEDGINAFAAGFSPGDAVIGVTRGCVKQLSRDELQGVIAHEFSHILNGDMRLNIRLIGVLNGILIIGMVGYWIFRITLYSGSSRSRNGKGSKLPIVLLGLIVMAIGFIGVLFGKLIKSAVSRQREFLADASSVQFTRNPDGIAGALKKIGGFSRGSKLKNAHAEEASHFFFSNGLSSSLINLMATHPPLVERIRRIDPSFDDGDFKRAAGTAGSRAATPAAAGFAGAPAEFAVNPAEVVSSVGAPQAKHLDYAEKLMSSLPDKLDVAAREPFGARAVIYSLLLNRENKPREIQLQRLAQHADPVVYSETKKIALLVETIGHELRLPLVDLSISTLKELSPRQYKSFSENVKCLVEADKQIDLFEFTLQCMIKRHLEPVFTKVKPVSIQYYNIKPVQEKCGELLSCLAYWGTEEMADAKRAFGKGAEKLKTDHVLTISSAESCGLQMVEDALNQLVGASPAIKRQLIDACTSCIAMDGKVTLEEADLLRCIGDSLDCPIPPFLPGQKQVA